MGKKISFLICSLVVIFGISDSVWGQIGVIAPEYLPNVAPQQDVSLRRSNLTLTIDTIRGSSDVNNEFGAGESATIGAGLLITDPNTNSPVTTNAGLTAIHLGSQNSKNIVINSYNAEGFAAGWINLYVAGGTTAAGTSVCGTIGTGNWNVSSIGFNFDNIPTAIKQEVLYAGSWETNTQINLYYWHHVYTDLTNSTHLNRALTHAQASTNLDYPLAPPALSGNTWTQIGPQMNLMGAEDFYNRYKYVSWNYVAATTAPPATPAAGNYPYTSYPGNGVQNPLTPLVRSNTQGGMRLVTTDKLTSELPFTTTSVEDPTFTGVAFKRGITDNTIPLIQVNGDSLRNKAADDILKNPFNANNPAYWSRKAGTVPVSGVVPGQNTGNLESFIRPTTVATASNNFNTITFNNLGWWYRTYDTPGTVATEVLRFRDTWTCCHNSDVIATTKDIQPWDKATFQGDTYLDAAVQLLNGARVCVYGDVMDMTNNIGSSADNDRKAANAYTQTNALIVLPIADRITLRTNNDFRVNMHHERDSLTSRAAYYLAEQFPDPDDDIYLYSGSFNEPIGGSMTNFSTIPSFHSLASAAPIPANLPYTSTSSSVFGVNGDYMFTGLMAEIHTDSVWFASPTAPLGDFANSNRGVIEVGTLTDGKDHFHIYSGGMIKNYEGCTTDTNFPMYFGNSYYGGQPKLRINTDAALYIMNFGNLANSKNTAALLFHTSSVDSIKYAFNGTGSGPLHIQALSHLRFNADNTIGNEWDATTNGNNIFVLSDDGNISTQKLNILSDAVNAVGQGYITFWAETMDPTNWPPVSSAVPANNPSNRFSISGNIFLNDDVSITRAASNSTQTNIIAENNIRTASFTSTNADDGDITNIISRKGDIYLGYSAGVSVFDESSTQGNTLGNGKTGNTNIFTYNGTGASGTLNILAGYDDQNNTSQFGGGNIYITKLVTDMTLAGLPAGAHDVNVMIPFSNEFRCEVDGRLSERLSLTNNTMQQYEHAGIILGAGRCGQDYALATPDYAALLLENPTTALNGVLFPSLDYKADMGEKIFDTGARGNIINNMGAEMDFNDESVNAYFRTRSGDIDMREKTNVTNLASGQGIVFLADNGNNDKSIIGGNNGCNCDEENNNIYFQDFDFLDFTTNNDGSIYIGADNNIKLQYGGLKDIGTWKDPFLSEHTKTQGYPCGTDNYHCDSDTSKNQARPLILDFTNNLSGGGVGIVASDLIDVYKRMIYTGGTVGGGMSAVPAKSSINGITSPGGTLRGENVTGYGLYIKSQANKNNWTINPFDLIDRCPKGCPSGICGDAFLHEVARVTFHDDARFITENSKVYVGSPVLEVYGNLELNTDRNWGSNSSLRIQTDSLIVHDSLIVDGTHLQLSTWSMLDRNMPVLKFGHQRFTPPFTEDGSYCASCVVHEQGVAGLDTIFVTFHEDAGFDRFHSLVADHTVITFLTDSFEHKRGNPIIDAKFYTDIFKIRNQVELWGDPRRERSGHFELISEAQMHSKDYSGIFARHLHMEPIAPCDYQKYSELWIQDLALDVISSSRFGGYGTIHADVHVETQGIVAPGYASLGIRGNCYERQSGTLKMKDLRLDKGAELHFSIGNEKGLDDQQTDIIEVDDLTLHGTVNVFVEKRCDQTYSPGCYPIILYKTVGLQNLNHLLLGTLTIDGNPLSLDFSTPGIVYLCVGENAQPVVQREVILPAPPAGVSIYPLPGVHYVPWGQSFTFKLTFGGPVYTLLTNRLRDNGEIEYLTGKLTANGEYEYTLPVVKTQPIYIYFGPIATGNELVDKDAVVWSIGNTLHINVNQQDIASIYSITGLLVKRVEVPNTGISIPMQQGVFIVTLKDGSVHKVIIR